MNEKPVLGTFAELKEISELTLPEEVKFDAVLLKTRFRSQDIGRPSILKNGNFYIEETRQLINKASALLKDGGLFFIWGLPNYLSFLGEHLSKEREDTNY